MVNCAVTSCKNWSGKTSKTKDGITFHRFPRDKERRKQWEIAVHREAEWTSTQSSAVCSEHFNPTDFYLTESGLRKLSGEAVPSINICTIEEPEKTILQIDPIEINPDDSSQVIQLKHKLKRIETIANNRKKRLKLLWQSKKRLKRKLAQMKCMVKQLIKHKQRCDDYG